MNNLIASLEKNKNLNICEQLCQITTQTSIQCLKLYRNLRVLKAHICNELQLQTLLTVTHTHTVTHQQHSTIYAKRDTVVCDGQILQ